MGLIAVVYILIIIIIALIGYSVVQIKLAGINVKDFWTFIDANQMLDRLYKFSKKYEKMSPQEQVIFLAEAEKIFSAFDKIPNILWEEEYEKYQRILKIYSDIKIFRWENNS